MELPKISAPILGGFQVFIRWYLKKNFHSFAINRENLANEEILPTDALVVYANHSSWWDPLTAMFMAQHIFSDYKMYAPIDAKALQKYQMFAKLGFFPVERTSLRSASNFLQMCETILSQPGASLWITPEGRFADVRDTTARLMPGLPHLAHRLSRKIFAAGKTTSVEGNSSTKPRIWIVPGAVEYTFWEERQPELLAWFGKPIRLDDSSSPLREYSKSDWETELSRRLRDAQNELAEAAIARDSNRFDIMLGNRSGSFFLYDWYRTFRGWLTGNRVEVTHSDKLT